MKNSLIQAVLQDSQFEKAFNTMAGLPKKKRILKHQLLPEEVYGYLSETGVVKGMVY